MADVAWIERRVVVAAVVLAVAVFARGAPAQIAGVDSQAPELHEPAPAEFGSLAPQSLDHPSSTLLDLSWSDDDPAAAELPWREAYFPFLDDEDPAGSVSFGDTSQGWVINAKQLGFGRAWAVLPKQAARDLGWGGDELIGLIERAATAFHARTASRMWIGNIGRRGGGDIAWSVSHNSGRDADIALSYVDVRGAPVDPPDLIRLDRNGISKDRTHRLDVARTWQTVRAFVADTQTPIQYLFLSDSLRQKVLSHARITGEPPALVARAAEVVRQPFGALPHDDHIHLRIYCSARDVEGGCRDTGLVHPWIDLHSAARTRRVRLAALALAGERGDQRRRAIERLAILEQRDELPAIVRALDDLEPEVRQAAAAAIAALGSAVDAPDGASPGDVAALARRLEGESDVGVRGALLAAIGDLGGRVAGETLARALAQLSEPPVEVAVADACCDVSHGRIATQALLAPATFASASAAWPSCDGALLGCLTPSSIQPGLAPEDERLLLAAVDAAGRADRLEPVDPLLALLDREDAQLRARAAGALARVTNMTFGDGWDDPAQDPVRRRQASENWRAATKALGARPRDGWLAGGFLAAGYAVPSVDPRRLWELARASARGDHLAYNAHRLLERLTGHRPIGVSWTSPSGCRHWIGWLGGNRRKLSLDPVPEATARACL